MFPQIGPHMYHQVKDVLQMLPQIVKQKVS